jgi:hypothetical protein
MKRFVLVALLALALALSGCGSKNSSTTAATTTASGTWQAVLSGGSGEASALSFVTTFSVNDDGSLSVTGIEFITVGSCFVSAASASGTLDVTTDANNVVTGMLSYVVQSGSPAGNTLTLLGTESGPTITGNWTLTGGAGCTGSGEFVMCQGTGACTVTTTT